jgi:hypothetical protein
MKAIRLTAHAALRLAQRAIRPDDLALILLIGTEVEGGYFVRQKDCQAVQHDLKRLMEQIDRLSGKRVVVACDRIVTAYDADHRKEQCLLNRPRRRRG